MVSDFIARGSAPADRAFGAQRFSGGRTGRRFAPPSALGSASRCLGAPSAPHVLAFNIGLGHEHYILGVLEGGRDRGLAFESQQPSASAAGVRGSGVRVRIVGLGWFRGSGAGARCSGVWSSFQYWVSRFCSKWGPKEPGKYSKHEQSVVVMIPEPLVQGFAARVQGCGAMTRGVAIRAPGFWIGVAFVV